MPDESTKLFAELAGHRPQHRESFEDEVSRLAHDPLALRAALQRHSKPFANSTRPVALPPWLSPANPATQSRVAFKARAPVLRPLRRTAPAVAVNRPLGSETAERFVATDEDRRCSVLGIRHVSAHGGVPVLALVCAISTFLALWVVL